METVADVGEFGLIARLRRFVGEHGAPLAGGELGIGDDAAVLCVRPGHQLLVTCDVVVEGRHYLRGTDPADLGWRAAAVNLSDIGAMGGQPRYALLSLGLRPEQPVATLERVYRGFLEALQPYGAAVAGGNVTLTTGPPFLDVTLLGEVEQGRALKRSGARPGDAILVTGLPGQAAAGLRRLQEGAPVPPDDPLVLAYRRPPARVPEGREACRCGVHAAIDTSDGLAGDLGQLCRESGVGAVVEAARLPVSPALARAAAAWGEDPLALVLSPSDDYELLLTCAPQAAQAVQRALAGVRGVPVTCIGTITTSAGHLGLRRDGHEEPLTGGGWDHFRA
ncbi:MAG: thiamine-phosphate kinase [Candidatus Latescibacterota bacterium]